MQALNNFLDADERVTIKGLDYSFHAALSPDEPTGSHELQFFEVRKRRVLNITTVEFWRLYQEGEVRLHRERNVAGDAPGEFDTPQQALRRRQRHYWTTAWDRAPVKKSSKKLAAFVDEFSAGQPDPIAPPSPETLRTWLRERGREGDRRPRNMGDRHRASRARGHWHPMIMEIWALASQSYWSNYKILFTDIVTQVRDAVRLENQKRTALGQEPLKAPGYGTMHRWLKAERTFQRVCDREGRYAAEREFKSIKSNPAPKRLMDKAIIDQKRMDVHLVDDTRQFAIGRPWLAVMMEEKSRMILGYTLTFEDPSVLSVMACIRMSLRGAPNLKKDHPTVEGSWEAFGVPRTVVVDNAWENVGSTFQDACEDFGISIEWAPVRQPQYKGKLERFFRTLDTKLVHKLPGAVTADASSLARRRIDPQSDAQLTLAELDEFVARFIVDVYSLERHDSLEAAPLKVWRDLVERDGIELADDPSAVDAALGMLKRDRTLSREGVEFLGLHYRSEAVDSLLADLIPLQPAKVRTGSAKVKIKYHPEDLACIYVFNEARNNYTALPCTTPKYAKGLSERVHGVLRGKKLAVHRDFIAEEEACANKANMLRDIVESYEKSSVKERRRAARLVHSAHDVPSAAETVRIDALSTRRRGNDPEKASVRTRHLKRSVRSVVSSVSAAAPPEPAFDPFAEIDWERERNLSRERLG
jgi:putative transposase